MNKPLISVIVCTYNRVRLLDNCLAGLCDQEIDNNLYEVIVVDNNSTDNTFCVVSQYMKNSKNIRYITEKNQGLSYARNKGYEEACSEYLLYTDDDTIAHPEYLSNILKVIKEHEPDILGGPLYPYYTEKKPRWFKDKYAIRKLEEKSGFSRKCSVTGANYTIKKDLLKQLGMFDVNLGMKGDDIGIGEERKVLETYRKRTASDKQKVYYALECYLKHYVHPDRMNIRYLMKRYYIGGKMGCRVKDYKVKDIIGVAVKLPFSTVWVFSKEIIDHGLIGADYIDVCKRVSKQIGLVVGGLNQMLRNFRGWKRKKL